MIPLTSVSAAFVPLASGRRYVIVVHLIGVFDSRGAGGTVQTGRRPDPAHHTETLEDPLRASLEVVVNGP